MSVGPGFIDVLDRADRDIIPLSATVEITHACNLRCQHCYLDLQSDAATNALKTAEWVSVFRELRSLGTLFLTLTGGEPLLRPDLCELLRHAQQLGFATKIFSNATLIDDAWARVFRDHGVIGVEVSLHGHEASTQDTIAQRQGAHALALAGIRALRSEHIPVLVKTVAMHHNLAELDQIRRWATSLGCEHMIDYHVTPKNSGDTAPTQLRTNAVEAPQALYPTGGAAALQRSAEPTCSAARRVVHIGPQGNVYGCTQFTTPLGNVRRDTLTHIWRTSTLAETIRRATLASHSICSGCDLLAYCNPCLALNLLEAGDLFSPSPSKCELAVAKARAHGVVDPAPPAAAREGSPSQGQNLVQLRRAR